MTTLNLSIYRGITFGPLTITANDSEGAPADLTGWSVFAEIRRTPAAIDAVIDLAPELTDAAIGEITIELTDAQTDTLCDGSFRWDLILENPTGERLGPYIGGSVLISTPVTQPT